MGVAYPTRRKQRATGYAARRAAAKARAWAEAMAPSTATATTLSAAPDVEASTSDFSAYYLAQQIVPPDEWDALLAALHRPLPVTFRWNAMSSYEATVRGFRTQWASLKPSGSSELPVEGAWVLPYDRATLAARESPVTREVHRWLSQACAAGAAQRQELVSMVPVALLGAETCTCIMHMRIHSLRWCLPPYVVCLGPGPGSCARRLTWCGASRARVMCLLPYLV